MINAPPEAPAEIHGLDEAPAPASNDMMVGVAAVGAVAVAVALVEVALIPGTVIAAAALAPKHMPQLGSAMQPMFRSTVHGIHKPNRRARSAVAETRERMRNARTVRRRFRACSTRWGRRRSADQLGSLHSILCRYEAPLRGSQRRGAGAPDD